MLNLTPTSNTSHTRTLSSDAPEFVEPLSSIVEANSTPAFMSGFLLDTVRVMRAEEDLERRLVEEGLTDSAKVRRIALPADRGEFVRFVREWEQKHRRAVTAGTIATLVLPLAACGGGGGGGYRPPEAADGYVIDGYVSGATVSRENGSGPPVTTDANGYFTGLTGTGPMIASGGIDVVTGQEVGFTMRAPEGATVISPLTTLVQALVDGGESTAAAYDSVAAKLGLTVTQLQSDPWASSGSEDLATIKAAVQVASLLSAAVTEGADDVLAARALLNALTSADDLSISEKLESFFGDSTLGIGNAKTLAETFAQANAGVADAPTVGDLQEAQSLPKVTISLSSTTLKAGESATVTFTFSEEPTGFGLEDAQAENGQLTNLRVKADSGGLVYTATFTPSAAVEDTTNVITVGTGWSDSEGNAPAAITKSGNYSIDTKAPTVALSTDDTALNIGDTATITLTFTEAPATLPAVTPSAGTLSALVQDAQNPLVYTATLTPPADTAAGSITFTVAAWADAAGNAGSTSAAPTIAVDTVAPTATITSDKPALKAGETATLTIKFSEAVKDFTAEDLSVESGTLGTLSDATTNQDGTVSYTIGYTPAVDTEDAAMAVSLATTYTDVATNTGTTATASLAVDTKEPTATVVLGDSALKVGETTTVTVTFSEVPTGFVEADDLVVENGALSNGSFDQTGLIYTATFTPTDDLEYTTNVVTLGKGWTDAAGNAPVADTVSANYTIDTKEPTATVVLGDSALKVGETTTVTVTFSEVPTGFVEADDLVVENGALSNGSFDQTGLIYTATFTPTDDLEYTTNVVTLGKGWTDAAGNAPVADTVSANYTIDTKAPTVTITDDEAGTGNIAGGDITYTFTFSEAVSGFTADDITVANGTKGAFTASTVEGEVGKVFTLVVTPTAGFEGNVTVDVAAGVATDAAGNPNTAATQSVQAVDMKAPTATITSDKPALKGGETATLTITFSEEVKDFTAADLSVESGTLGTLSAASDNGDGTFSYTIVYTPAVDTEDAAMAVSLANTYTDVATNTGTAATANLAIDTRAPDAPVVALVNDTGSSATDKITSDGSLSVTGETSATIEYSLDDGVTWTSTFAPDEGVNTVWVRQTDTSGNISEHTEFTFTLDSTAPTVRIASSDTGTANIADGTLTYTFTFSEPVGGFTIDDVEVENGEKGLFTQVDAKTYQLEVTPDAGLQGSLTLKVAAGAAADVAFNASAAATDYVQAVDTLAPTLSITDDELGATVNSAGGDIVFSFRFSEVVSGFAIEDVNIVGGTASGALIEATGADAGKLFTLVVTPTANYEGNLTVSVAQGAVTDLNGNPLAVEVSATQAVDTKAPSVPSINVVAGNDFIIALEKDAGVSLSGTAEANTEVLLTLGAGNVRSVTADAQGAWTYTLVSDDYSAMGEGAETIRAIARDAAGNQSAEATRAVSIDTVLPTLTITLGSTALTIGQSTLVTFQFSEAPLNFTAADISLGSSSVVLENLTVDAQDATRYTATLRASKNLSDAESVIQVGIDWTDAAGNAPAAATSSASYAVTAVNPIVVNANGGGNFTTLQAAVDASVAGNDIRIDAGSFNASAYSPASTAALKALNSLTLANGVSLTLTAAQASGENIVALGAANVVLTGLGLGTDASDGPAYDFTAITIGNGALNATVTGTGVLNANSMLGALALGVESGKALTLSAAQASGRSITGLGSAVVTDLDSTPSADLSRLLLSSPSAVVDRSFEFTGTLGLVAVTVNDGAVFTTSAAVASGKAIGGGGRVVLTALEASPAADLSKVTASDISAALATVVGTPVIFSGNAGNAYIKVDGNGELQLALTASLGASASFDLDAGTTLSASAMQLNGKTVVGAGVVNVEALAASTDLSGLADGLQVTAMVRTSIDISANGNLGSVDSFVVAAGRTLTLSGAQADGATVSGDGAVVLTALGETTNLAGVTPNGGSMVLLDSDLVFSGDLGSTEVMLLGDATFSTTASIASGKLIDGTGTVVLTGLEGALAADLTAITASTLKVVATTTAGVTDTFAGSLGNAAVTVDGEGIQALAVDADLGTATFTVEAGASLRGSAAQLAGVSIDGEGTVEVLALAAGSDLSSISLVTNVVAYVETNLDLSGNTTLAGVDSYVVASAQTLTLTAAQASGKRISGDGKVVITDLDAAPTADLSDVTASGGVTILVDTTMVFAGSLSVNAAVTVGAGVQLSMSAELVDAHVVSGAGELKVSGSIATTDFGGVSTQSVDLTGATLDGLTALILNDTSRFVIDPAQASVLEITGTEGANTLVIDVSGLDFGSPGSPLVPVFAVDVSTAGGNDRVQFRFGDGPDSRTVKLMAGSKITMGGGVDILESANGKLDISAASIDFLTIETLQINSTIVLSADQLQLLLDVLGGQLGGLVGGGVIEVVGDLSSGTIDLNKFGSFTPGGLTPPTIRFPAGYTDDADNPNNFRAPPEGSTVIIQIADGQGGFTTYGGFDGSGFTPAEVTVFTAAQLVTAAGSTTVQKITLGDAITLNQEIDLSDTAVVLVTGADKQLTLGSGGKVTMTVAQADGADIAGTGTVTVVAGADVSTLAGIDFSGILAPTTLLVAGTLDGSTAAGLGRFAVDVASTGTFTVTAAQVNGRALSGEGVVVVKDVDATPAADFSGLATTLGVTAEFDGSAVFTGNFGGVDQILVTGAGTVLTVAAAAVSGRAITGDGAVTVNSLTASADLSGVAVTGAKLANIGSNLVFSGKFGSFDVVVAGSRTLTTTADRLDGVDVSGLGRVSITSLVEGADLSGLSNTGGKVATVSADTSFLGGRLAGGFTVTVVGSGTTLTTTLEALNGARVLGTGEVTLTGVESGDDLSNILVTGAKQVLVSQSVDYTNVNLGAFSLEVGAEAVLTLSAGQASGRLIGGAGGVTVTALGASTDLSGISVTGAKTATVTGDLAFAGSFGGFSVEIAASATLTATASRLSGVTVSGDGNIVVTGLTSAANPDLGKIDITGTKLLQIDGNVQLASAFSVPDDFSVAVTSGSGLTATAGQLSGIVVTGAGSVTVIGLSATADLDGIVVSGAKLVEVLENITFSGSLGDGFQVVVAGGVTLKTSAATLDNVFVFGAGNVTLTDVDASVDLSRLLVSGSRSIEVAADSDLTGAELADFSITLVEGAVLTLSADQVAGRTIDGVGTLKITGLGSLSIGDLGASIGESVSVETTLPVVSIITPIAGDNVVNTTEAATGIVVTGTATNADGQTLTLDFAGVQFSVVVSNGTWSVTVPSTILRAISDASYAVQATVSSADGNTGSASTQVVVDASVPAAPTFALVAGNDVINATEATGAVISGTAEANATVELSLGGQVKMLAADAGGSWSYTVVAADYLAMGQGSETLSAVAIDAAGNRSPVATKVIQIDTVAPSVAITDDEPGVANIAGGDVVFTFTFSEAVTGFSADDVTVSNGSKGAFAQLSATTYSLIVTPNAGFEGNLTVDVAAGAAQDAAGNASLAAAQRVQAVDTLAPVVTVTALGGADRTVSTLVGDNVVSGSGEAGRNVTLLSSTGAVLGTVRADTTTGSWTYTLTADNLAVLGQGADSITARQTDAAGNVGESAAFVFSVDTVAPSLTINPIAGDDLLVSAEAQQGLVISGTASGVEDGQTVTVRFNSVDYAATVSNGTWSTAQILVSDLQNGVYPVTATVADAAGNPAQAAARNLTVALEAPAISIGVVAGDDLINIAEAEQPLTLSGTAANIADDTAITVSFNGVDYAGTVVAGSWSVTVPAINLAGLSHDVSYTVSASAAGATASRVVSTDLRAPTITVNTVAGDNLISIAEKAAGFVISGTASAGAEVMLQLGSLARSFTAGADGAWSYRFEPADVSGFVEGNYVLAASARDAAGNVGTAAQRTIGFDLTAPAAATVALLEDTGASATDALTRNGTLSVTGVEQGASVSYSTDGGVTWAASFTPVEGLNNVKVRVSDAAGNRAVTDFSFTLDTATAAPRVALLTDSGASASDGITDVGTLNVSGVEAGAVVEYSVDGGDSWSGSFVPVVGVNAVQVRATDLAGNQATTFFSFTLDTTAPAQPVIDSGAFTNLAEPVLSGTAEVGSMVTVVIGGAVYDVSADELGVWSVDLATATPSSGALELGDGSYTVSVTATDAAGNVSVAATQGLVIDTAAPAQPLITSLPVAGVDFPVISGTAEPGSTITLTVDRTTYAVTVDELGAWSVDLATAVPIGETELVLGDGVFPVTVTATDAAGNGSVVASQSLLIDTVTPVMVALNAAPNASQFGAVLLQGAAKLGIDLGEFEVLSPSIQASVVNDLFVNRPVSGYVTPAAVDGIFDAVIDVYQALAGAVATANAMTPLTPIETLLTVVTTAVESFDAAQQAGAATVAGESMLAAYLGGASAIGSFATLGPAGQQAFVEAVVAGQPYVGFTALLVQSQLAFGLGEQADALAALNAAADVTALGTVLAANAGKLSIDLADFGALSANTQAAVLNDLLANRPLSGYASAAAADGVFDAVIDVYQAVGLTLATANAMTTATPIAALLQVVGGAVGAFSAAVAAGAGLVAGQQMALAASSGQLAITSFSTLGAAGQQTFVDAVVAGRGSGYVSFDALLAVSQGAFIAGQQADALAAVNGASVATLGTVLETFDDILGIDLDGAFATIGDYYKAVVLADLVANRGNEVFAGRFDSIAEFKGLFDAVVHAWATMENSLDRINAATSGDQIDSQLIFTDALVAVKAAQVAGMTTIRGELVSTLVSQGDLAVTYYQGLDSKDQALFRQMLVDADDFPTVGALLNRAVETFQFIAALDLQALAAVNAATDPAALGAVLMQYADRYEIELGAGSDYAGLAARQPQLLADLLANKLANFAAGFQTVGQVKALFDAGVALRTEIVQVLDTVNAANPSAPLADIGFLSDLLASFGSTSLSQAGFTLITSGTNVYPLATLVTQGQAAVAFYDNLSGADQAALRLAVSSQDYASFSELLIAVNNAVVALTPLNVVVAEPGEMLDVTSANDLDLKLVSQDGSTATFAVYVDPLFGTIQSATLDVVFGAGKVTSIEMLSGPTGYLASVEQAGVREPLGEFYPGQDALLFGWNSLTAFDPGLGQALFTFKVGLASPSVAFDISVIPVDLGVKNYDALTADVVATFDPAPLATALGTDARDLLIAGPGEVEATGGLGADVFAPTSLATQLTIKDFSGSEAGGHGDKVDFGALLANLGYTAVATEAALPVSNVVLPWLQAAPPPSMDNVFAASGWTHANGVGTLTVAVDANASAGVIDLQTLQIAIHTQDPTPLALEELGLTLDLIQYNTPS